MSEPRSPDASGRLVRFGVFEFNPETGELWKAGRRRRLQEQPRQVLRLLVGHAGQLITRDELRQILWPDDTFVDVDTGLNVVVTKIRQALDDSASMPRFVETLPRRGYRFIAPVDVATPAIDPPSRSGEKPETSLQTEPVPVPHVAPAGGRRLLLVGAAVLAIAMFGALGWLWSRELLGRRLSEPRVHAVAVLPLDDLSGGDAQPYLADGIAEALTTDLASIRALRVVSRQSTKQYRGTTKTLPAIARELAVDAVIEGSVARDGERVRVTVQLIDAVADRHVWAETYERDFRDIVALQHEAAQAIAREIRIAMTVPERARLALRRAVNPAAYDAYLRGRYSLSALAETEPNAARAALEFHRAIEIDPTYAPAYVGMAQAQHLRTTVFQGQPTFPLRAQAVVAARRAVELDPDLGSAHGVLARVLLSEFEWSGAETSFQRALDLAPNDPQTLVWYGYQLLRQKRVDEAIEVARRAEALDPLDLNNRIRVGFIHFLARQYDEAARRYEQVLALDQDRAMAKWFLSSTYTQLSRHEEALSLLRGAIAHHGRTPALVGQLAAVSGRAGLRRDAQLGIDELLELSRREYVSAPLFAMAYAALPDRDHAFEWFERAYEERSNLMLYFTFHPLLDALRDDPRYQDLATRINRPHAARDGS
jgi:TolB-like protein/DNA-binding winged helix-turn-helix (wHTH) protein/Tfp pilus assembly protein PilF